MKKFKKIYIEITNVCNLRCSFCSQDNLPNKFITLKEFEIILKKIDKYTDYVYLHVKGEPLLHPDIEKIISLCSKYNKKVNLTTNGVLLLKNVSKLKNVRQINISLQSITDISVLDDIFEAVDILSQNTFISYRLWAKNNFEKEILEKINNKYNSISKNLSSNVFLDIDKEFIWPDLTNDYLEKKGTCFGTRTHIAILVSGKVVPCCLDSKGIINLGNIFDTDLESIISSDKFLKMKKGFENNKKEELLCQKCSFDS